MKKRKEMTNRFIQTKLDEIVSKYVENNLNEHGTTKTGKGDSTKDLIAAIQDRCDYQVGDIPVSYIFDYNPEYTGAGDSRAFVWRIVGCVLNDKEAWIRYSDEDYQFYKHIAECLFAHEINRLLDGLKFNFKYDLMLVPVPAHSKILHLNRFYDLLLGVTNQIKTGIVGHINSFVYAQEEGKKLPKGGKRSIPEGRFDKKSFYPEGNEKPHVILFDILANDESIRETAEKLRHDVGAEVIGAVVLGKAKSK